jgi:hypothetical protein
MRAYIAIWLYSSHSMGVIDRQASAAAVILSLQIVHENSQKGQHDTQMIKQSLEAVSEFLANACV